MEVASFTVDHDRMKKGVFVSRKDQVGAHTLTTFDLRMKQPNAEPVLDNPAIHTMEHLMAVYLRSNTKWKEKVIYVGPMGCRTGMYLILNGNYTPQEVLPLIQETFAYMMAFDEPVPATTSKECGNCLDHNLTFAKWEAAKYYNDVLSNMKEENMVYPS